MKDLFNEGWQLFFLMILSIQLPGQRSIECTVTSDTIYLGNLLELKYTVQNEDLSFELENTNQLPVISGPNISRSMSIINGKRTSNITYSYQLYPKEIGVVQIPPAFFKANNEIYEIPPFEILVLPNAENRLQKPVSPKKVFELDLDSPEKATSKSTLKKKKKRI